MDNGITETLRRAEACLELDKWDPVILMRMVVFLVKTQVGSRDMGKCGVHA